MSLFPDYRPDAPHRRLAMLQEHRIVTETMDVHPVSCWRDLYEVAFKQDLLLFTGDIVSAWWFPDAMAGGKVSAGWTETGVSCLMLKLGRYHRWIVKADKWGGERVWQCGHPVSVSWLDPQAPETLCRLREVLDSLGLGDYPTPSSLGLAAMRILWPLEYPRFSSPSKRAASILRETLTGGRADFLGERKTPVAYELDINNAYAHAALRVPAGSPIGYRGGLPGGMVTGYQAATILASDHRSGLSVGPVHTRTTEGGLSYPISGEWSGWYWTFELDAAEQAGYTVSRGYGYGWSEWNEGLGPWAMVMHQAKTLATAPHVKSMVKLATVAGLGRFIGSEHVAELTQEQTGEPYNEGTGRAPDGLPWAWYVKRMDRRKPELLPHIGSYINAVVRLATYWRACLEGNAFLASNFDAVYTVNPGAPNEWNNTKLGGWKCAELHEVTIPAARHILSREKIRLPGVVA